MQHFVGRFLATGYFQSNQLAFPLLEAPIEYEKTAHPTAFSHPTAARRVY